MKYCRLLSSCYVILDYILQTSIELFCESSVFSTQVKWHFLKSDYIHWSCFLLLEIHQFSYYSSFSINIFKYSSHMNFEYFKVCKHLICYLWLIITFFNENIFKMWLYSLKDFVSHICDSKYNLINFLELCLIISHV